jgi:hypothetical protein
MKKYVAIYLTILVFLSLPSLLRAEGLSPQSVVPVNQNLLQPDRPDPRIEELRRRLSFLGQRSEEAENKIEAKTDMEGEQ